MATPSISALSVLLKAMCLRSVGAIQVCLASSVLDSFNVNLRATATSSVSGSGNLLSEVGSMAGARLKVNYYFEGPAQVSAPASGALMLLGVGLIGWLRRKTQ